MTYSLIKPQEMPMDIRKIKNKMNEIASSVFHKKPLIEEAKSNLLNFIVKTKREKSLKGKIQKKPPKTSIKISKLEKKLRKK